MKPYPYPLEIHKQTQEVSLPTKTYKREREREYLRGDAVLELSIHVMARGFSLFKDVFMLTRVDD